MIAPITVKTSINLIERWLLLAPNVEYPCVGTPASDHSEKHTTRLVFMSKRSGLSCTTRARKTAAQAYPSGAYSKTGSSLNQIEGWCSPSSGPILLDKMSDFRVSTLSPSSFALNGTYPKSLRSFDAPPEVTTNCYEP
jgi:hypothetical protein